MKASNKVSKFIGKSIPILLLFSSCGENFHFSNKDLLLTKPYYKKDTVIYISETNLLDTIIYFPRDSSKTNPMNFEQGFDDRYLLEVKYSITHGSYHHFLINDDDTASLFFAYISPNSYSTKEFYFLGLEFDKDALKNVYSDTSSVILFNKKHATSYDANINEGINSFVFDVNNGITSFVDDSNRKWSRKK